MSVNLTPATITELLLSATDGITVAATAGVVDLPNSGYVVGGVVPALVTVNGPTVWEDTRSWVSEHLALVAATPNYRYGAWTDSEGVTYLDVVEIVHERAVAVQIGHQRNEIAIWDITNGVEIPTR